VCEEDVEGRTGQDVGGGTGHMWKEKLRKMWKEAAQICFLGPPELGKVGKITGTASI
jgi:hypothetical protein